jgi:formylglycine-generating enzyme required for sulfatase activity
MASVELMVKKRLMVARGDKTTDRTVEIAHEALLRTWEPLVQWIETGRQQLEQWQRAERLRVDLAMDHPVQARLAALQGLLLLAEADPELARPAAEALAGVLQDKEREPQEWLAAIRLLGLLGGEGIVRGLSGFLEQQQLQKPTPTEQAAPMLEALCQAAASLQDIHRRTPPTDNNDERWLLLPSATVDDNGHAVSTQLVKLRLWAIPRLQAPGAWFEPLGKHVALTMVMIPAGSFLMGSPVEEKYREPNEGPQHLVALEDFWISQTPITQAQWHAVMKNNPSAFSTDETDSSRSRLPVEQVSWHDAITFCSHLTENTGYNYTLPSEAQWEYACRAGTKTPFHCGETLVSEIANFCPSTLSHQKVFGDPNAGLPAGKYQGKTSFVDQFPSNRWGLLDAHGNVREWCLDDWNDGYADAPVNGQAWLSLSPGRYDANKYDGILAKTKKRLRGGDWGCYSLACRSASRDIESPDEASHRIGFRVVCLPQDSSLNT